MHRYIASGQRTAERVIIHCRYPDRERVRRSKIAQIIYFYFEANHLYIIHNRHACEAGMPPINRQQLKGCCFQVQIKCVILIGEVPLWREVSCAVMHGETKGGFEAPVIHVATTGDLAGGA